MKTRTIFSSLFLLLFLSSSLQAQNLFQAVANRDVSLARTLLNAGANPDQTDPNGQTPLLLATANGDLAMAALLLDEGADVNLADPDSRTPLMHAADSGFIDLLDLYLDRQADPLLVDNRQMNAFDYAAESNAVPGSGGTTTVDPDTVYARLQLVMNP